MATLQQELLDTLATDAGRFLDEELARIDEEVGWLKKIRGAQGLDKVKQDALDGLTNKAMDQLKDMV